MVADNANPAPRRRRLRFQFSLRTFLIVSIFTGAAVGWTIGVRGKALRQREAVGEIRFRGNWSVTYDYERDGLAAPRRVPRWLLDYLGVDYFADVIAVKCWGSLREPSLGNDGLAPVGDLRHVQEIEVFDSGVTDAGLATLSHLRDVRTLSIAGGADGTGLADWASLPRLRILRLRFGPVSDESLAVLGRAVNLEELDLRGGYFGPQEFSDAALGRLAGLQKLKRLDLRAIDVGDEGLAHLARLTSLEDLGLSLWTASGDGIRQLRTLSSLRRLALYDGERKIPPGGLSDVLEALAVERDEVRRARGE